MSRKQVKCNHDLFIERAGEVFVFFLICLSFLFFSQYTFSQNTTTDSLKKALKKADEEKKVEIREAIGYEYIKDRKYNEAIDVYRDLLRIYREKNDTSKIQYCLNHLGIFYFYLGDYENSISFFRKYHDYNKLVKDSICIAEALNNIGNVHYIQGNYSKAIDFYFKSLRIKEKKHKESQVAKTYFNIANVFKEINKPEDALTNYNDALEVYKRLNDSGTIASCYNNIGIVYENENDYKKALDYYRKAANIRKVLKDSTKLGTNYINIGSVLTKSGYSDSALIYYDKAMDIAKKENRKHSIATILLNKSLVFQNKNLYKQAIQSNLEGLKLAREMGSLELEKLNYRDLSDVYGRINNYEKAYHYNILYNKIKDSIFNKEKNEQITEIETKYQTEKKEQKISLLQKEKALQESNIKKQKILIIAGGVVLLMFVFLVVLIYRRYQDKIKANTLLQEKNIQISQQKEEISAQRDEIEAQRDQISSQRDDLQKQKTRLEKVHKELTQSIGYARKIQSAALPTEYMLNKIIPERFILFIPQGIVGGDFYWTTQRGKKTIVVAADCTGHGVPGGFMSMLGMTFLNEIVNKEGITEPNLILNNLRDYVIEALHQEKELGSLKDGMDISICVIDYGKGLLSCSGANNPVFIVQDKKDVELPERSVVKENKVLLENRIDKMPISIAYKMKEFTRQEFLLEDINMLYMASDGYSDQFGGENNRKYLRGKLKELLLDISDKKMEEQYNILKEEFVRWKGQNSQNDDVLIMGIKPNHGKF